MKLENEEVVEENTSEKEVQESQSGDLNWADLYESSFKSIKEGDIVDGTILDVIDKKNVLIDIGYKSEGIVAMSEFSDNDSLEVGSTYPVFIERLEDESGMVVLSKEKAGRLQGWEKIVKEHGEGDVINGLIRKKVKGGFMVDVGIEAFLPASLAAVRNFNEMDKLVGQTLEVKIVKINTQRRNIVVSRKDVLQEQYQKDRDKLLQTIEKGQVLPGIVKNITDFGAFIDLGGLDGLLHITDISWGRISHPGEVLKIGDEIDVMVLEYNKENSRVSLGLKQKSPNPWLEVESKYPVGAKTKGKVVNLMPYGAFIELEKGVEGLVHVSELSWTKKHNHPSEVLSMGDAVEVLVLEVDKEQQKISLGMKQLDQDPWTEIESKYEVGSKVNGTIRNITEYGAFVEIEPGIDGLIHISDISWTKKINHPKDILKKGQEIEGMILGCDKESRKMSIGLKQLEEDPWQRIIDDYKPGTPINCPITKVTTFGLFVKLEDELEGLVHISELAVDEGKTIEEMYQVGQEVEATVIRVDSEQKKIALTMR